MGHDAKFGDAMIKAYLYEFDAEWRQRIGGLLCGVDEAGRGPLAGPVCCAAVALDPDARYDGLDDSKKLTPQARERLYDEITAGCVAWNAVLVDNGVIDRINILQATLLGMAQAIAQLNRRPALALIDGNKAPQTDVACRAVVGGDALSASVAAASVVAKVTRDRYMQALDLQYPQYGFARHKGYPTKQHYEAIDRFGLSPYHRLTFIHSRLTQ